MQTNRKLVTQSKVDKKGFAIIVVAGLAGMVLLLGASLLIFVQVESAAVAYDQKVRTARSNARMALNMAVGDLQKYAGPDQVATATANLVITDGSNNYWTGVWDSGNSTKTPSQWLVTRGMDSAVDSSPLNTIKLVGRGANVNDAAYDVIVPLESISTSIESEDGGVVKDRTFGQYAYWVGDQGVKASFGLWDRHKEVNYDDYFSNSAVKPPISAKYNRELLSQMVAQTNRFPIFDPNNVSEGDADVEGDEIDNPTVLSKSVSDFQFQFETSEIGGLMLHGFSSEERRNRFHDRAYMSRTVFENRIKGGLKTDASTLLGLSEISVELDNYLNIDRVEDAGLLVRSNGNVQYHMSPNSLLNDGESVSADIPSISLVITGFHIDFEPVVSEEGVFSVSYNGYVELWNPYTASLLIQDLYLYIKELPNLQIFDDKAGVYLEDEPVDLSLDINAIDGEELFPSAFKISSDELSLYSDWNGGRVYSFSGSKNITLGGGVTNTTTRLISELDGPKAPVADDVADDRKLTLKGTSSQPIAQLLDSNGLILHESISSIAFKAFDVDPIGNQADPPLPSRFGFTWEMEEPNTWGERKDPRILEVAQAISIPSSDDPTSSDNSDFNEDLKFQTYFVYNSDKSEEVKVSNDIPMFELPIQKQLSLLNGRHAFLNTDIEAIGEKGSPLNSILDEYFISTLPLLDESSSLLSWSRGDVLANARLEVLADIPRNQANEGRSAESLFLKGAFNINSTSVDAWISLLMGLRKDELVAVVTADESNAFFPRFSQTATGQFKFDNKDTPNHAKAYRPGIRAIKKEKEDDSPSGGIKELAEAIVDNLKKRGNPFLTLQAFLDFGVIEEAIKTSNVNTGSYSPEEPAYLSQADVLTAIAPFLTTRSDTFIVRAYGNALNPEDDKDIWAEAYCEAIVQRFPEKHPSETDSDPMSKTAGGFGRQFKIIAFRWMLPEEI